MYRMQAREVIHMESNPLLCLQSQDTIRLSPYSLQPCKQPSVSYRPNHPCFIFASINGHCQSSSSHGMVTQQQQSESAQPLGSSASSTHGHYNADFAHCPSLPVRPGKKERYAQAPIGWTWVIMVLRCASPASVSAGTCYQISNNIGMQRASGHASQRG